MGLMGDKFHNEFGQVADEKAAHELADLEAPGRNAALAREKELMEGLTEAQKVNLAIMGHVKKKYPDACDRLVDDKGHEILRTRYAGNSSSMRFFSSPVFLTQDGVVQIESTDESRRGVRDVGPDEVWNVVVEVMKGEPTGIDGWMNLGRTESNLIGRKVDIVQDRNMRERLSHTLDVGQSLGGSPDQLDAYMAEQRDLRKVLEVL